MVGSTGSLRGINAMGNVDPIAVLQNMDTAALLALWNRSVGTPAPRRISRDLLLLALAYHKQEQMEGGLSEAALKRLAGLADRDGDDGTPPPPLPQLRPGTRLVREWRGEAHQVTVLEDGFEYREMNYRSLSQIARSITGTQWSGPLFFGLRKANGSGRESSDER